jgi:DNA helicase-2/ATP-dependent DNA helicase PcrA
MSYLETLNSEQKKAVETTEGPLMVIAGAGAGKTRVITYRILHLIHRGVAPESILAITFTNKAAKEMRERVRALLADERSINLPVRMTGLPFVSTFHALGVHILKENARLIGMNRHFSIYDRGDSVKAVKEGIIASGFDPKQYEPRKILGSISRAKGEGMNQQAFALENDGDYYKTVVADAWEKYEKTLREEKALDFDDLLLKAVEILEKHPEVKERYQNQWQYIHIDEYQDTNTIQYKLADLIAAKNRNLCVVGDIDQNIYSWRGADIAHMLAFEHQYPEAQIVRLEENYRSTKTIIAVSNDAIKKNRRRQEKNLFTNNADGEKIALVSAFDEIAEAMFVAGKAGEVIRDGVDPSSIAVLYRANFQSRALEEAFLKNGIAYQVLGTRFFERKEVKDVLSFVRLALNPDSISDLKRIINVPARGIGKVTLLKIVEGKEDALPVAVRQKIQSFRNFLARVKESCEKNKPSHTIAFIINESGLAGEFERGNEEDQERFENVKELVTLATRYDEMSPLDGIEKLIEDSSLQSDQDELDQAKKKEKEGVKLMTIHASKGLEFSHVFITGMEEGLFPYQSDDINRDDEEERRLFYVALTRAEKKVFLTFAQSRRIFGNVSYNMPSEFVTEIDNVFLEAEDPENHSTPTVWL